MGSQSKSSKVLLAVTGALTVPGGIAKANLNVMRALDDLTHANDSELTVLSLLERDEDRPEFLTSAVDFHGFEGNKKKFATKLLRHVPRDVLFCFDHVSLSLPLLPFVSSGLARTVIFSHGSESWRRIQRLNRLSIKRATKCLTNSEYTLRKMREHLGSFNGVSCPLGLPEDFALNSEVVIRNGLPLRLTAVDGTPHTIGERMLLLVARMLSGERQKGHEQLLRIFPELRKSYPDLQLVFAGDGDDRERLADMARANGSSSAVFLPGFVGLEALKRLYQYCFAYVMPSMQEGFGIAYLEAMNFGKPCIGCFDQGTADIIVEGETGYLIHDQNSAQELTAAIQELLDNPANAQRLGRNGFTRLHERFTATHHQGRIREHITPLIHA